MKIKQDVLNILNNCIVESNKLFLPMGTLDRKLYVDVNKVLELAGGKWNRKLKCHLFEVDIEDLISDIINNEEIIDQQKELQFFETPREIALQLIELAEIKEGDVICEPSAGKGAIVSVIKEKHPSNKICAIEKHYEFYEYLFANYGFDLLLNKDFLELSGLTIENKLVNKFIANPPFSKQQDIKHILKMYSLLPTNGILVSVASAGVKFRTSKLANELRNLNPEIIDLPIGAFKESGTMVSTVIVKLVKL
jgi:type I restriction-modification system DNA methylase subunit